MKRSLLLIILGTFYFVSTYGQTITVQIGSGNSTTVAFPSVSFYSYSYSQQIYLSTELIAGNGWAGNITKVRFYYYGEGTPSNYWNNWTVYIGITTKTSFSNTDDWVPFGSLTQVFSGIIPTPEYGTWLELNLSTPFYWDGVSNIVVATDENSPNYSPTPASWGSFPSGTNRGLLYSSDITNPNPVSPPSANFGPNGNINQIQFEIVLDSCSGIPDPGNTIASTANACRGENFILSLQNITPGAGVTFTWQSSSTGSYPWIDIGISTPSQTISQIDATYYRCLVTCDGNTTTSDSVFVDMYTESIPYIECFFNTSVPDCWNTSSWSIGSTLGVTGNAGNNIYKNFSGSATTGNFTTADIGLITAGMKLGFDYKVANHSSPYGTPEIGSGYFVVAVSTDGGETYINLETLENNGVGGWQSKTYDLSSYVSQNMKVRFTGHWLSGDWDLAFDNISVASCLSPTALSTTTFTNNSTDISWTTKNGEAAWKISYGAAPLADPDEGTIMEIESNPYQLTDLSQETTYDWYVSADCEGGDLSLWSPKSTFSTFYDCDANTELTCGTTVTSGNLAMSGGIWNTLPAVSCGFNTPGKEILYSFTPAHTGLHQLQITNINSGSGYIDYFYKPASEGCSNAGWICIDNLNALASITFGPLIEGHEYYIMLDAEQASGTANHTFQINCPVSMSVVSTTVGAQNTVPVGAGTVEEAIIRLDVVVNGVLNPLIVTSFTCNTNGSSVPVSSNVNSAKIYYTGTSAIFNTNTLVGSVAITNDGSFSMTVNQELKGDFGNLTNHFWLTYNITCNATVGNKVDGEFSSVTIGGTQHIPNAQSFAGDKIITDLDSYQTKEEGNWSDPNTWACGVPPSGSVIPIIIKHNVNLDFDFEFDANMVIAAGKNLDVSEYSLTISPIASTPQITIYGMLNVSGGTLNVNSDILLQQNGMLNVSGGTLNVNGDIFLQANGSFNQSGGIITFGPNGGGNSQLVVNGFFDVSDGTLNINGQLMLHFGGTFNQSGGDINVDGNSGSSSTSVPGGSPIVMLNVADLNSVNLTNGTLTIVDPHYWNSNVLQVSGTPAGGVNVTTGHTIRFGDGVSIGNESSRFRVNTWASNTGMPFGNVIINGPPNSNRYVTCDHPQPIKGDLTINNGGESRIDIVYLNGNLTVNLGGKFTSTELLYLTNAVFTDQNNISFSPCTTAQSITGVGLFRNSYYSPTANLTSFRVNNTSGTPIALPAAMITGTGSGSVSGTLELVNGILDTGNNKLTLGSSSSNPGTLLPSTPTSASFVTGTFERWIGTTTGNRWFPLGTVGEFHPIQINYTFAPATGGKLAAIYHPSSPGTNGLPLIYNDIDCRYVSPTGHWQMAATNLSGGVYSATVDATGFKKADGASPINDPAFIRLAKRPDAGAWADYAFAGAPASLSAVSASVMSGFSVFGIIGAGASLPLELITISATALNKTNLIEWITASEQNTSVMVVERNNGISDQWEAIGQVEASGFSSEMKTYHFEDLKPSITAYYRIRSIDRDGTEQVSRQVFVDRGTLESRPGLTKVYPVPVSTSLFLDLNLNNNEKTLLQLMTTTGQTIMEVHKELNYGFQTVELDLTGLPSGIYFVRINNSSLSESIRIVNE